MGYRLQFGPVQVVLVVVALVAVLLLATMFVGRGPADPSTGKKGKLRPRLKLRRGFGGGVLAALAVFLTWIMTLVQGYLGLTGEVKAAHVVVSKFENMPGVLSVDLTLYGDDHATAASRKAYQLQGDRWVLQANIVELEPLANTLGLRGGYKVTRLYGQYADGRPTTEHQVLLGDDQDFFKEMEDGVWWTKPFVRSAYGNAVISNPGEYDVFISRDAITARRADR
ncbi:MAG: hypothetical protein ACRC20_07705 [Segniliparus sp.]|uniref:hypothetical protein n=1 Tax=Segniliparus sp. TaxID=2804064 RepID=UPI003F39BC02